jgi:hypothetical protein
MAHKKDIYDFLDNLSENMEKFVKKDKPITREAFADIVKQTNPNIAQEIKTTVIKFMQPLFEKENQLELLKTNTTTWSTNLRKMEEKFFEHKKKVDDLKEYIEKFSSFPVFQLPEDLSQYQYNNTPLYMQQLYKSKENTAYHAGPGQYHPADPDYYKLDRTKIPHIDPATRNKYAEQILKIFAGDIAGVLKDREVEIAEDKARDARAQEEETKKVKINENKNMEDERDNLKMQFIQNYKELYLKDRGFAGPAKTLIERVDKLGLKLKDIKDHLYNLIGTRPGPNYYSDQPPLESYHEWLQKRKEIEIYIKELTKTWPTSDDTLKPTQKEGAIASLMDLQFSGMRDVPVLIQEAIDVGVEFKDVKDEFSKEYKKIQSNKPDQYPIVPAVAKWKFVLDGLNRHEESLKNAWPDTQDGGKKKSKKRHNNSKHKTRKHRRHKKSNRRH